MKRKQLYLIYDKQCPLCEHYSQMIRIRESVGELVLIDAREESEIMHEITLAGLDIDQGMVLKMKNNLYYGAEAIQMLSLISSRNGFFNRLNYWLFCSKYLSKIIYPIFRSLRNLLLKILSRKKINNLNIKNNRNF